MNNLDALKDAFDPFSKNCSICNTDHPKEDDDNEFWVRGFIGILPVAFCEICYTGVVNMVLQLEGELPEEEQ
jgi:hypothetical protein